MNKLFPVIMTLILITAPTLLFGAPTRVVTVPSGETVPAFNIHTEMETRIRVSDRKAIKGPAVSPGSRDPGVTIVGATLGWGIWKVKGEVGMDYTTTGPDVAERNPLTMNAKVVLPELAFNERHPGVTVGVMNYWLDEEHATNMVYGLLSYTLPYLGRIAAGGYQGDEDALGGVENGMMASWDTPVSERVWVGVDYIGGNNKIGSINAAVSFAFSKRSSFGFGYNLHTAREYSGADTVMIRGSFMF